MTKQKIFRLCIRLMPNKFKNLIKRKLTNYISIPEKEMNQISLYKFGCKNENKIFSIIKLHPDWIPTAGFFAIFNRVLNGLYFADRFNLIPFVDNWNRCAYEEKNSINNSYNVFQYYFKPVSSYSLSEIMQSKSVCFITDKNCDLILKNCNVEGWYVPTKKYISEMARIFTKYIEFNKQTKNELENDKAKLGMNGNVLGVHYRGSDYKLGAKNHPAAYQLSQFEYEIRKILNKNHFDSIFLATDDEEALNYFKKKFSNLFYFTDSKRSKTNISVAFLDDERKNGNFLKGYEVIRDMYMLGNCQGLLAGQSQVSLTARVLKEASGIPYITEKIIDSGINTTGINWMEYFQKNIEANNEKN